MRWWPFRKREKAHRPRRPDRRMWEAAKGSLLTAGWPMTGQHIDVDLRQGMRVLRSRARQQFQNNDHLAHFVRLCRTNIVGPQGIRMQSRALLRNGRPDERANEAIEQAFADWGRMGTADVTGTMSWRALQRQFADTAARDGEVIARRIIGWDNRYGFALQMIDPDTLDVDLNKDLSNGNRIVMGVEIDEFRRPVRYYFIPERQASSVTGGFGARREHIPVPAAEIYHCYLPEWVWQTRGIPWAATALLRLNMLGGYEDAEITAARIAASKMGFYVPGEDAAEFTGDGENEGRDDDGNFIQDARPGEFEVVPYGYKFESWDPQHPNSNYGEFVKNVLRSISSGLGVNYNTLANDLQGVNYTSLRHGMLNERDIWMCLQDWMVEQFCDRVFADWLDAALLRGAITGNGRPLQVERRMDYRRVSWQPRRWAWVDPQKDVRANREAYDMRTKSLSEIIRESGRDPDEVWEEIRRDHERLEELGIEPPKAAGAAASSSDGKTEDEDEDETEAEDNAGSGSEQASA